MPFSKRKKLPQLLQDAYGFVFLLFPSSLDM